MNFISGMINKWHSDREMITLRSKTFVRTKPQCVTNTEIQAMESVDEVTI